MDGLQERLRRSIQARLSLSLSVAILVVAAAAGAFSFAGSYEDAQEAQDDVLRQVAALLKRHPEISGEVSSVERRDADSRLFVQRLATPGSADSAAALLPLPGSLPDGLQTLALPRASYRVMVVSAPTGERIAVAQETEARDELARNSAARAVLPLLILVPILLLVVADIVRKLLRPVAQLSAEIEARGDEELHALPEQGLPLEIRPFVVAINRLLGRVRLVLDGQRRFVADAAHELRSPLTALSLQAERLENDELAAPARGHLNTLRRGIERSRALLEQLLALARVQSGEPAAPARSAARRVMRDVLEELLPLAEAKRLDIGIVGSDDAGVAASEAELGILLKNLVENAIRYTPAGGRVDLAVQRGTDTAVLVVEDSGPGIAAHERSRVLDPFYRVLGNEESGSGLGLAIVKAVADRLGAVIRLEDASPLPPHGLRVTVELPLAQGPP
jgi:two-component system OmpR family sensor kinase